MNLKKFVQNYMGVGIFYLILAIGAILISTKLQHINANYTSSTNYAISATN